MTMSNIHPMHQPDLTAIQQHLDWLFGDVAGDGMVEIAWTDPESGAPSNATLFDVADLDEAAEYAYAKNAIAGQVVYVGAALRKPGTCPFARTTDTDFARATAVWCDLDEPGAADAVAAKYRDCRATFAVITGKHPYTRAQVWWKLDEPTDHADRVRDTNRTLAVALGGDRSVVNPGRIMRLAGTIAWPKKAGRIVEPTELHKASGTTYPLARIREAFKDAASAVETPPAGGGLGLDVRHAAEPDRLLTLIRGGQEWHNNMLRLVGHWLWRGWTDEEILSAAESCTLPGYSHDDTRREVGIMIRGGRAKGYTVNTAPPTPSEQAVIVEQMAQPDLDATPLGTLNPRAIPQRQWVLGRRLIRKFVTLTVAPGGSGKSLLTMEEMIAVATGQPITGQDVHVTGPAWIYNNEDPLDELQRRIAAIFLHHGIPFDGAVARDLHLNSGRDRRLLVATTLNGAVVQTPDVDALEAAIRRRGIVAMTIDPFVRVHQVEENDNAAIDFVADIFGRIADRTGCAFNLVHHTRKLPAGYENQNGNADTSRGAGSLVAAARVAHTVLPMSTSDAENLGIPAEDRRWYVRLDDAKGNMAPPPDGATWFRWQSVALFNGPLGTDGDEVGVLEPWDAPDVRALVGPSVAVAIWGEVNDRWQAREPFGKIGERALSKHMVNNYGLSKKTATALIDDWLKNGIVVWAKFDASNNREGFRVGARPGTAI